MSDFDKVSRPLAAAVGAGYLAVGVLGFIATGFDRFFASHNTAVLGFSLNGFHNVVHLTIGAGLILAARAPRTEMTQGVLIGGGVVYLVAATAGFIQGVPVIGIENHFDPDNFLHLFSGAAAIAAGLIGTAQQTRAERSLRSLGTLPL